MTHASRSLFVFGIYVLIAGVLFLAAPQFVIATLHLPPATLGWARMVGLLALVIGAYDVISARAGFLPYVKASVWIRVAFATGVTIVVASGEMPPPVLILAAIDAAGAVWTAIALRTVAAQD